MLIRAPGVSGPLIPGSLDVGVSDISHSKGGSVDHTLGMTHMGSLGWPIMVTITGPLRGHGGDSHWGPIPMYAPLGRYGDGH